MYNFQSQRQIGKITDEDIKDLRNKLRIGDRVWMKIQKHEEYADGRIRIHTKFKKVNVLAKFSNIVVVSGKGTKVHTMQYKEILLYELEREQKSK